MSFIRRHSAHERVAIAAEPSLFFAASLSAWLAAADEPPGDDEDGLGPAGSASFAFLRRLAGLSWLILNFENWPVVLGLILSGGTSETALLKVMVS